MENLGFAISMLKRSNGTGEMNFKKYVSGTSLVVQWLRLCTPSAGGPGSIPGRGTRGHMLQLKISQATMETWCSRIKNSVSQYIQNVISTYEQSVMRYFIFFLVPFATLCVCFTLPAQFRLATFQVFWPHMASGLLYWLVYS